MKGRETKGAPSADLLVCFPSRAHLTLMPPKTSCSPARPSDAHKRRTPHHHHLLKKPSTRGGGQASPVLWAKTKPSGSEISEPTSPKVTCAGQIKVRPRTGSCKNWQSVMEEIERIHKSKRNKKKQSSWVEALGFKKEVMQFLTCLRSIRFDFRCFGSFPEVTSDDEDEEEEGDDREYHNEKRVSLEGTDSTESSRTVFSKWFMVLQENQNNCSFAETDMQIEEGSGGNQRTDNIEIDQPAKEIMSEGSVIRKAEMYQEYMKKIPIPTSRGSVIPCKTWMGLASSIKQLYGQPLHYLTNLLLKKWDQLRIGAADEHRPLDSIIQPVKAETTIWLVEEVHRHTSSHHHIAKLWQLDPMYQASVDPVFPKL